MKRLSYKVLSAVISLLVVVSGLVTFINPDVKVLAGSMPSHAINVVYDDSDSMYVLGGTENSWEVDTWCQAKYSMEVFAAMLGTGDMMNIYYMSDFDDNENAPARISISGDNDVNTNISMIHNETTTPGGTSLNSIKKACSDLETLNADEKWLVILTDGRIDDNPLSNDAVSGYLELKDPEVKVIFLAIGEYSEPIRTDRNHDIYSLQAVTSEDILDSVTQICNRIFNANELEVSSDNTITFDVSMKQLVVFAQGENVSVNSIDGVAPSSVVNVSYSECDAVTHTNAPDASLMGVVATFDSSIDAGTYSIDVANSDSVQVFYVPNVRIAVNLLDSEGNSVLNEETLDAGSYSFSVTLIDTASNIPVDSSELLGDVTYSVVVDDGTNAYSYDSVTGTANLVPGTNRVTFKATYLWYNILSTSYTYTVNGSEVVIEGSNTIEFEVVDNPTYEISGDGIADFAPVKIHATTNGREFTSEEWASIILPALSLDSSVDKLNLTATSLTKSDEIGYFLLTPGITDGFSNTRYKSVEYTISANSSYVGSYTGTLNFNDTRNLFPLKTVIVIAAIFLLGIMYVPGVKKYLPKMDKRPKVIVKDKIGHNNELYGSVDISVISTIFPLVPQRATITYVAGKMSADPLEVRAIGAGRMVIENYSDLNSMKGKISIGGNSKLTRSTTMGASTVIRYEDSKGSAASCKPCGKERL